MELETWVTVLSLVIVLSYSRNPMALTKGDGIDMLMILLVNINLRVQELRRTERIGQGMEACILIVTLLALRHLDKLQDALTASSNERFTQWQKGALLGRGSFGSVYEGICDGGSFIAVKEVSLLDQGEQEKGSLLQLEQEIAMLSKYQHDNIVRYLGSKKDESNLYIYLELMTKGSLLSLYKKYHLQDSQVSAYTRQILHGLKYLHDHGVVHRDIKCANLLIDANGTVKLADFGLAKVTKFNDLRSCKGTPFWMAPEVVNQNGQGYGLAADIWSLGCTVLEMLTRQRPYYPMEFVAALYKIGNKTPPAVPDFLSPEARKFISKCLEVDPSNRPTAAQLLDHPFVRMPLSSRGVSSPKFLVRIGPKVLK